MTKKDLFEMVEKGELKKLHSASRRGYESRKGEGHVEEYAGRFGTGYVLVYPRWDTTKYVYVTYYVVPGTEKEIEFTVCPR